MVYDFKCERCHRIFEEVRSIADRNTEADCICGSKARRIFSFPTAISVGSFEGGYFGAFGKIIKSKTELNEEIRRIKGESGREIVEVGNDSLSTIRKEKKKVNEEALTKELRHRLKHGRTNNA